MGKQHSSSDDRPARRGNGEGRPGAGRSGYDSRSGNARGGYEGRDNRSGGQGGFKSRGSAESRGGSFGGGDNRGGYGNDRGSRGPQRGAGGPGGRSEGYSPARPTFGQGSRPGGARPGSTGDRPTRSGYGSSDRNERGSYGSERGGERGGYGNDRGSRGGYEPRRPERSGFGGSSNRADGDNRGSYGNRRDDERPRRAEGREERTERPERPAKPIWQGQPVRYEGKPTVPRGEKGERNRKFIKQDPTAEPKPVYTGRDERRSFEERGEGSGKPGGYGERPRSENAGRDERPTRSFNRDGADERRPYNREGRDERPRRSEGGERPERGKFDKPRSYGERPANAGSGNASAFRERRDAMRDAVRGGRTSGTSYGSRGDAPGQAPDYKNLKHYEADKNRGNKRRRDEEDFGTGEMRLNRYIANAGICSRREADALIAAGEIRVNGEVVTEMGYKVQPSDTVQYGKTNLNREKLVYVLLNKPKDFITTTDDPEGRKTVMDLVANASKERIFPVGRLDRNTTGLLLFTNDGEVAQKLSHPSHKNKKIYQAELDKPLTAEHLRDISAGVELEDGKAEIDDVAVVAGNPHFVGVELHIGRNRIVRRIFEHLGYDVVALDRVQYAGLTKKDLPRGKWRFLSEQEVIRLKYFM